MLRLPLLLLALHAPALSFAADKPNFVWILSEDNSKHYLRLFDPAGAPTPNIAKLAAHGVIFEHAFSNSPVCSVARTTLATCIYAPRVATQYHRKSQVANLPDGWRMFPAYLRETGYHTTNNSKKDYNAREGKGVWDASSRRASWRDRPSKGTPFFHMRSFGASHESSLHFSRKQMDVSALTTDPKTVTVAPYHPDTELFRYTYARYHDRIRQVDDFVGRIVEQLQQDGLLEETFIFYFGDHGGVLPRSKGYVYESGLHVPLVVRVPKKWSHLVDRKTGSRAPGFVSFVDFGPTLLHLAGIAVPEHMDGRPFLGEGIPAMEVDRRDEAFGYADRFDEKYDLCRSLRKGRFKYIRNYQAFYPDALQNNYRYKMLAYAEWRTLYREGKLDPVQRQFFESRPAEVLYDLQTDPHETKNLAGDPEHRATLSEMRRRLAQRVKGLPDLSLFPESVLVEEVLGDPHAFAQSHAAEIARLVDVADLSLLPFSEAKPKLAAALSSKNAWERYWALMACSVFAEDARSLEELARARLADDELLVRLRAAEFLAIIGAQRPQPTLKQILQTSESHVSTLLTLNAVVFLRDGKPGYEFDFAAADVKARGGQVSRRLEYLQQSEKD